MEGADEVGALKVFGFVGPEVFEFLGNVEFAKLVEHVAHEARLADGLFDFLEAVLHHLPAADDAGHRARHLAEDVVRRVEGLLARGKRIGERLDRFQPGVDDGHREHPDAVLHARGERGDLGEDALVCRAGHHPALRPLRPAVGADDDDGGTQVLDKVPSCPCNGEQIEVVAVAQNLDGRVVLEQQVHVDGDAANVLEDGRLLHVIGVGAEAVEAA